MLEGSWRMEIDGLCLAVDLVGTTISNTREVVSFDPNETFGEWCNNPMPVTALGSRGENIVNRLKTVDGVQKIRISACRLVVRVNEESCKVAAILMIRELMVLYTGRDAAPIDKFAPLRDIRAGKQPAPTRHVDYAPLGATA